MSPFPGPNSAAGALGDDLRNALQPSDIEGTLFNKTRSIDELLNLPGVPPHVKTEMTDEEMYDLLHPGQVDPWRDWRPGQPLPPMPPSGIPGMWAAPPEAPKEPPGIIESAFLSCYIPAAATGRAFTFPLRLIPGWGSFWSDRDKSLARAKDRIGISPCTPLDWTIDIFGNMWAIFALVPGSPDAPAGPNGEMPPGSTPTPPYPYRLPYDDPGSIFYRPGPGDLN